MAQKSAQRPPSTNRRSSGTGIRRLAALAVAFAVLTPATAMASPAQAAQDKPVDITVDGADVAKAAQNRNGLTFKGFGALSGNATSSLLLDYKSQHPQQYWQMIRVLFGGSHPLMNTIKVEMGNDRNTSTGPNPAVMRHADDYPDVAREPGFQLAADAMKVNPNIKVSILRWKYPAWVGGDDHYDNIYKWYKNTILAVYREYGYMIDSVNPHINESKANYSWTEDFAHRVHTDTQGFIGAGTITDLHGKAVPAWSSAKEKELFHHIRVIISDEAGTGTFGHDMVTDAKLRDSVDIAGYHYNTSDDAKGDFTALAEKYDKEVWNSEAQATFSVTADRPNNTMSTASGEGNGTNNGRGDGTSGTGIGGINSALEMANTIVKGFTASRRTNFIYQPAMSAFYDGYQYSSKELLTMHDPWSGYISWDGALAVLEQFSRFAKTGYETDSADKDANGIWRAIPSASRSDLSNGNPPGRGSGADSSRSGAVSYMTLAAPDKSAFSTVIVNDSAKTRHYRIKSTGMHANATLEQWTTQAAGSGQAYNARYMRPVAQIDPDAQGWHTITVSPWSVSTVTSLDDAVQKDGVLTARAGEGSAVPTTQEYAGTGSQAVLDTDSTGDKNGVTDDQTLYADDFEYAGKKVRSYKKGADVTEDYLASRGGDGGASPRYTMDTNGAFEVVRQSDGSHVLRQQVGPGMDAGAWNGGDPRTTIGDARWRNYTVSTKVRFTAARNGQYALLAARQWGNSSNGVNDAAAELKVEPTGRWTLSRYGSVLKQGDAQGFAGIGSWNTIAVRVGGAVYTAFINGKQLASYTDPQPQSCGRIQLGSSFDVVDFDDLKVSTIAGSMPYYTDLIDNMHQRSWTDSSKSVLAYNQKWQHLDGQGMYVYKRSISTSTGAGASLSYTFDGTGIDLLGASSGRARLSVSVDGTQIEQGAPTMASSNTQPTTFRLRGLKAGHHTVVITTDSDQPISIDAVGVIGTQKVDSSKADTTRLSKDVQDYGKLSASDFNPGAWSVFSACLDQARQALADPSAWGLDTPGADCLADRLEQARANLVPADVSTTTLDLGLALAAVKSAALPSSLTIGGRSVPVEWDSTAADSVATAGDYTSVTLSGTTKERIADPSGASSQKLRYRFTVRAEVLPNSHIAYFIDTGANPSNAPEYAVVKAAVPGLKNQVPDQPAGAWGHDATSKTYGSPASSDKFDTGDYGVGPTQTYTLPLEAGTYRLTVGVHEWWGSSDRSMAQTVSWKENGQDKSVKGPDIPNTPSGRNATSSVEFTLAAPATVTYTLSRTKTAVNDPICSWLAVARVPRSLGTIAVESGSSLPATVSGQKVTWDSAAAAAVSKTAPYATTTVSGVVGSGAAAEDVTARVEVIPRNLCYYIDSGTRGVASPQYTAVHTAVPGLLNAISDQSSDGSVWGYAPAGVSVKGSTDLADKYSTGLWQKGDTLTYYLPLQAGTYELTAGFTEWWGMDRQMYAIASQPDGTELARASVPLSKSSTPLSSTISFTLAKPMVVRYVVTRSGAGSQDPVISWLAVSQKQETDLSALKEAIAQASSLTQADYTADSWKPFADALAAAQKLVADGQASQKDADAAAQALRQAQKALVRADKDDQGDHGQSGDGDHGDSGDSGDGDHQSSGDHGQSGSGQDGSHGGQQAGHNQSGRGNDSGTTRGGAGSASSKKQRTSSARHERGGLLSDTGVAIAGPAVAVIVLLCAGAALIGVRRKGRRD